MEKTLRILLVCTAVALLAACGASATESAAPAAEDAVTRVLFEEGERFAGHSVAYGEPEQPVAIEALPGDTRLIMYLSRTCGDCTSEYDGYQLLSALLEGGPITTSYLWQNALPEDGDAPDLPRDRFYRVGEDLRLGDWVPTYFVTEADGTILFKSIELGELAAYLADALPEAVRHRLLADWLERTGTVVMLTSAEPAAAARAALEAFAGDGRRAVVAGPEKDLAWADYRDSAGIFAAMSGADATGIAYLYAEGGALSVASILPG